MTAESGKHGRYFYFRDEDTHHRDALRSEASQGPVTSEWTWREPDLGSWAPVLCFIPCTNRKEEEFQGLGDCNSPFIRATLFSFLKVAWVQVRIQLTEERDLVLASISMMLAGKFQKCCVTGWRLAAGASTWTGTDLKISIFWEWFIYRREQLIAFPGLLSYGSSFFSIVLLPSFTILFIFLQPGEAITQYKFKEQNENDMLPLVKTQEM